jgi:DNA-binding transcriptional ArsR family regulator
MDISGDGSITLDRRAFKALASETRVEILKRLDGTQKTVSDLARDLDMNKATMFQHLEQLVEVGLVKKDSEEDRATTIKEAPNEAPVAGPPKKWVYYRLSWKGKNVLHPERVKIAIALSLVAVSCLLALVIYAMLQGASPAPPGEKDRLPPMVVSWDVDPVRTDSGMLDLRITVQDNVTGKVSGLDGAATVLQWGVATDGLAAWPDIVPWTGLNSTLNGMVVRAFIPATDWSLRGGKYLVITVELKDLAGNSATYRFSERVIVVGGPQLVLGPVTFDKARSGGYLVAFTVVVTNAGTANASNVTIGGYMYDPDISRTGKASTGGTLLFMEAVGTVGAGQSVTVNLTVNTKSLRYRYFFLMVDPDDHVGELNETDNVLRANLPSWAPEQRGSAAMDMPGMELWAAVLALGVVAFLARRRMRGDGR